MKLTKTLIDNTMPAADRDVWLWDSDLPGFGVRINPHGRKTYVIRYRNKYRKQRKLAIARCVDMPPQQARELARQKFGQIRAGADPLEVQVQDGLTLGQFWDCFLRDYSIPYNKPQTVARYKQLWNAQIKSRFANKAMTEITRGMVLAMHSALAKTPYEANRAVALLSKMYNTACEWELLPANTNPARRIKKYTERIRDRTLSPAEIKAMVTELSAGNYPDWFKLLVRLWLLTGCRNSEIRTARTEWIDWDRGLLLLPDSKTGQKVITLSSAALALLEEARGREWIIPGRIKGTHRKSPWRLFRLLCDNAGIKGATPHTLRHTVGTLGHQNGMSQREIAEMLGHKQLSTTARYLHGVGSGRKNADKLAELIGI